MYKTALRLAVSAGIAVAALGVAEPAYAYHLQTAKTVSGSTICKPMKLTAPAAAVVLHLGESKATSIQQTALIQAVGDIDNEIGKIGGSGAKVKSLTTTSTRFTFNTFYGDKTPTIHVGFVSTLTGTTKGVTNYGPLASTSKCTYNESHIELPDFNIQAWDLYEPSTYYDATDRDSAGALWLRSVYLHELLHAFGLHHSGDSYAMMNYGIRPWANRADADMMRPLPDDAQGLRFLYPADTSRNEVAVLNTYYTANAVATQPATGDQLCKPSVGTSFSASLFATWCAPGTTKVCPGDQLYARYTVANYSTTEIRFEASVYLSTDDQWTRSDTFTWTTDILTLAEGKSSEHGRSFTIPKLSQKSGTTLYPIIRIQSWTDLNNDHKVDPGSTRFDWIPLRGTVRAC